MHGSPGIAGGMVFWGGYHEDNKVHAVDMLTGVEIWNYDVGCRFQSSPAITDGVLYIAAIDGYLYAFGTGLKYTYLDDLFAEAGENELIVTAFDSYGVIASDTISFTVTGLGLEEGISPVLSLINVPNPFTYSTEIEYRLQSSGHISLHVYDITGRLIQILFEGEAEEGLHSVMWNGRDSHGQALSSGIYYCRLVMTDSILTRALCILR